MPGANRMTPEQELHEAIGALDVLFTLREEFAQWLEEAQDEERKEELQNVYRHISAMEDEYQRRREDSEQKAQGRLRLTAPAQARRPLMASATPGSLMQCPALSMICSRPSGHASQSA